jgi:hypothetical protein
MRGPGPKTLDKLSEAFWVEAEGAFREYNPEEWGRFALGQDRSRQRRPLGLGVQRGQA